MTTTYTAILDGLHEALRSAFRAGTEGWPDDLRRDAGAVLLALYEKLLANNTLRDTVYKTLEAHCVSANSLMLDLNTAAADAVVAAVLALLFTPPTKKETGAHDESP